MQRLVFGALSGLTATMAMTAAMRGFWPLLPKQERYPLPPREITGRVVSSASESRQRLNTVLAHFGFGALAGVVFGLFPRRPGALPYGLAVWAVSYLGWIPAFGILAPAYRHPPRRNLLMIAAHMVWGTALGACMRLLETTPATAFRGDTTGSR